MPETFDDFLQDECYIVSEHMSMGKAAHDYLVSRKLDKVDRDFYYCHDNSSRYFGRLIIPFFNEEGECVYFQARYLGHEKMKIK